MSDIPWVEKYRPNLFNNIILNQETSNILNNMIKFNLLPNLLLYGPPGTGKTTTIINFINKYIKSNFHNKENINNSSLILHLNASDERGIEIIRNNILSFVKSDNLFSTGRKFVILDEVDYMTKTAQVGLKTLIQNNNANVTYYLICNYITKIETSLQNELVKICFNVIDKDYIYNYLKNILDKENLYVKKDNLINLIKYYNNDIRSMLNFLQSNYNNKHFFINENLFYKLYNINISNNKKLFTKTIFAFTCKYNNNVKLILLDYLYYIIDYHLFKITDIDVLQITIKHCELFFYNVDYITDVESIDYVYNMVYEYLQNQ